MLALSMVFMSLVLMSLVLMQATLSCGPQGFRCTRSVGVDYSSSISSISTLSYLNPLRIIRLFSSCRWSSFFSSGLCQ